MKTNNSKHETELPIGTNKRDESLTDKCVENDPQVVGEIQVEELAIDGICGVY